VASNIEWKHFLAINFTKADALSFTISSFTSGISWKKRKEKVQEEIHLPECHFWNGKNKIKERKIESENCPICADTDN
jgi:hypothetical protein